MLNESLKTRTRAVAIVVFDEVEVLDFCGPFEIFSVTGARSGMKPFAVHTVAEELRPITTRGGLRIIPDQSFETSTGADIILVPGGLGTRREMNNPKMLQWVKDNATNAELVLSVCTGALVLGKAGLLEGLTATTHHLALEELRAVSPLINIDASKRFIDNGRVIVAAGISAGMDMTLHIVSRLLGEEQAAETARYMELSSFDATQSRI